MTNYFEFYDLAPSFLLDEGALKRLFYQKSREYHPDFYTLETEERQAEILVLSTLNNEAYKALSDFHKRMYHILDLHGHIAEEGKAKLPQAFLMEMMDVNEAIMELQFDPDLTATAKVKSDIATFKDQDRSAIQALLDKYTFDQPIESDLVQIRDYYFKHKYLLRLEENLDKIQ